MEDKLVIKIPVETPRRVSDVIRLRPEDAVLLSQLQLRTGMSNSELAGLLIRWAAERVVVETRQ